MLADRDLYDMKPSGRHTHLYLEVPAEGFLLHVEALEGFMGNGAKGGTCR